MTRIGRPLFPELTAARELASHRRYLVAYPPAVLLVGLSYALTQAWLSIGVFAFWALRFLTLSQLVLSVGFAFLFPWLILLDVFLWRHPHCVVTRGGRTGEGATVGATLLGILPNMLCCTPIIPTLLALFVSGGSLIAISAPVQHALSVSEPVLDVVSLGLLWLAIRLASRRLATEEGERIGGETTNTNEELSPGSEFAPDTRPTNQSSDAGGA